MPKPFEGVINVDIRDSEPDGHIGFRCVVRADAAQEPQQKEN